MEFATWCDGDFTHACPIEESKICQPDSDRSMHATGIVDRQSRNLEGWTRDDKARQGEFYRFDPLKCRS